MFTRLLAIVLQKDQKATTDVGTVDSELKEADPIEKAEKDFWKIIDEEKRRRDRKTALVSESLSFDVIVVHLFSLIE